jgi:hypothetical protein
LCLEAGLICLVVLLPRGATVAETETTTQAVTTKEPERVLRHAVFFKFKDGSKQEDLQQVIEAFRRLPQRIDAIKRFQWGTNVIRNGVSDGFTHCFLLTMADEQGRDAYLPHAEHKAFGNLVGPHLDRVFVIDYWGTATDESRDRELKHAVFFKVRDDAAPQSIKSAEEAFAALPTKIPDIKAFEWGINNSPEGHDDGFTHCFMLTFDSEAALDRYVAHPEHQALVKVLTPVLDKLRVMDFWAAP